MTPNSLMEKIQRQKLDESFLTMMISSMKKRGVTQASTEELLWWLKEDYPVSYRSASLWISVGDWTRNFRRLCRDLWGDFIDWVLDSWPYLLITSSIIGAWMVAVWGK